jgi:hypothetical protein
VAVNVLDPPTQIVEGEAAMDTLIDPLTNTVTDAVVEQPLLLVPVTI